MLPILVGSKILRTYPVIEPRNPTTIKKPKFRILTAVPEVILVLVICKTGTSSDDKLAFPASIQNIIGISIDFIFKAIRIQTVNSDKNVMIEAPFKNLTLLLRHILHIVAFIILKTAATIAIIERTVAALPDGIEQKSSKNFLPITV